MVDVFAVLLFAMTFTSDDFCSKQLDHLLALHDSYGLPHPPKNAILVRFVSADERGPGAARFGKRLYPGTPMFGFSRDGKTVLDEFGKPFPVASIEVVKPDPTALKEPMGLHWLHGLEDAIRFHARGWKELARTAYRKWLTETTYGTSAEHLSWDAWEYWIDRLHHDPDTPLATIAKRLKQIEPDVTFAHADNRKKLLASLEAALKPRNSKPGSDEALIDALIEARGWEPFGSGEVKGFRLDPRYRAVLRRGLDAVPALIAHLDDDRLVRCYSRVCGCGEDLRVRHIVFDILMQINGDMIISGWRGVLDNGLPKDWPEEIEKWHADARKLGEEKFLLSRALDTDEIRVQFRPGPLLLLAEKYPKHLPDVFRKSIDTKGHSLYAWEYAKAIAEAKLPDTDKKKAFERAVTGNSAGFRTAGLYYLRRFDPKGAKEQLLRGLERIPSDESADDTAFAFIAAEENDADVWKALARVVRRAKPTQQIDIISAVLCAKAPEGQKQRIAFLADFLYDEAVSQFPAGRPSHEAGHVAALQLAELLTIRTQPYPMDWSAESEWWELREQVKGALWR